MTRDAQFVQWSCGCKGLVIEEHGWVIQACDSDVGPDMVFHERSMLVKRREVLHRRDMAQADKTGTPGQQVEEWDADQLENMVMKDFTPLPYQEVVQLLNDLSRLIADGYGLRQLQGILSHKWQPFQVLLCTECNVTLGSQHLPTCGKKYVDAIYVVESDCEASPDD